jgi:hypothetical protein
MAVAGDGFVDLTWEAPLPPGAVLLAYDDGTVENNLSIGSGSEGDLAVRFTPSVYPSTILSYLVYFDAAVSGLALTSADFTIWTGNGTTGPDSALLTGTHAVNRGSFETIDVSGAGIQITGDDFFVSFHEISDSALHLAWDESPPSADRSWVNCLPCALPWQTLASTGIPGFDNDLLIRAIVLEGTGASTRLAELTPQGKSRPLTIAEIKELRKDGTLLGYTDPLTGANYIDGSTSSQLISRGSELSEAASLSEVDGRAEVKVMKKQARLSLDKAVDGRILQPTRLGLGNVVNSYVREGLLGFNIWRSTNGGGPFTNIANVDSTTLAYTDSNVVNGTTYYYYLTALFTQGESGPSDTVSATPTSPAPADTGVCYATLGNNDPNAGSLITIDVATGAGTLIGPTGIIGDLGFPGVPSLAIKSTGEMFATDIGNSSGLWRVDAATGAGTFVALTGLFAVDAIAFDGNDVLYAMDSNNNLYIVDETTGATTLVGPTAAGNCCRGIEFDPTTGILWGGEGGPGGNDGIHTINTTTGAATLVGNTGLGSNTPALHFDQAGNLYASMGGGGSPNNLISIDKATGVGTVIGPIGFVAVAGMSSRVTRFVVGVEEPEGIPTVYQLAQNFPNPFNPSTTIQYGVPTQSRVSLKFYNVLGQEIATLVDEVKEAGYFNVVWNGRNQFGSQIASGMYFYRLEAKALDGSDTFRDFKKLLLLK